MRVLVTGAYGIIGSTVLARLYRDGHQVVGAGRALDSPRRRFPYAQWVMADFTRLSTVEAWRPLLTDIDAVVNCVGVLQDGVGDNVTRVQLDGTVALFRACVAVGIRRIVHVSAIGAAADAPTAFIRTKAQADAQLASLDLDWAILRPALVLAPAAYGGAAMLRAIAGLPLLTPVAGAASPLQVVGVDDIAETVSLCMHPGAAAKVTWDLAHPQVHRLGDIVVALRRWHGFPRRPLLNIPRMAEPVIALFGEIVGLLGWRTAARRTALAQLRLGAVGDPSGWISATGIQPKSLDAILAERPASVQDRWFARLYLLKQLAIASLALFWILTGVIALGPGRPAGVALLTQAGVATAAAELIVILGGLLDIVLGGLICVRAFTRIGLLMMLILTLAYLIAGTILTPQLWLDPLGPLLKTVPIVTATLFTLAIVDDR